MAWLNLVILQVGFFMLLLFVLQKLFHGHLIRAIKRMEGLQDQNLKKEAELKRHEEAVTKDCQARIRKTDEEIRTRRSRVETEVKTMKESAIQRFDEEQQGLLARLQEKEKSLERRFEQEAQRQGSLIACGLVEKTFSAEMLEKIHEQLVKELLESLSKPVSHKVTLDGGGVRIETAYPLTEAHKESLKKKIAELVRAAGGAEAKESAVKLKEEIDKKLVAGFVIYLDQLILDGSLKSRFEKQLGVEKKS